MILFVNLVSFKPIFSSPLTPLPLDLMVTRENSSPGIIEPPILEESFTIHLGSQLKQMHNIRILSANVMELCDIDSAKQE